MIVLTTLLAIVFPFELFIFAYAVFGPAHYFTQISWLHDRNYYSTGKDAAVVLTLLAVLASISQYSSAISIYGLPVVAFLASIGFAFVRNNTLKVLVLLFSVVMAFTLMKIAPYYSLFISIFLPTLIHVYLFTGAFILFGNLKAPTISGWVSLVLYIGGAITCVLVRPSFAYEVTSLHLSYTRDFSGLIEEMISITGNSLSESTLIVAMRLTAFAYTYHYLNWFSKTKIIEWHKIPRKRVFAIIALYAVSLGVYGYDYHWGLTALFFFSYLHVLLEFPLNLIVFREISEHGRKYISSRFTVQ